MAEGISTSDKTGSINGQTASTVIVTPSYDTPLILELAPREIKKEARSAMLMLIVACRLSERMNRLGSPPMLIA